MPVRDFVLATEVVDVAGGAGQLVVASTNVNDAGSAAGTVVFIRLPTSGVLDSSKIEIGTDNDSSFAFVTGTILTTQVEWPWGTWEQHREASRATKMAAIGAHLANGEFCVNHSAGLIVGKKATTGTSDTVNYSYRKAKA